MKDKRNVLTIMSVILSTGILFGCNDTDENEPDPSEEPSEQQKMRINNCSFISLLESVAYEYLNRRFLTIYCKKKTVDNFKFL
ncbi:hypothetical protein GI482_10990 [Bacillus sp. N3536]|nr:hypothetical protein GI482_10990 [Bacillus sp. N3536]